MLSKKLAAASVVVFSLSVLLNGQGTCTWTPLGSGTDGEIEAMAVFDDGSGAGPALYVGGSFTTAGGVLANNIARWDGAAWHALGDGVTGGTVATVSALAVFDDASGSGPELYVGGVFTTAGTVAANSIAKWDGGSWDAIGAGLGSVTSMAVFDDGGGPKLYAASDSTVRRWSGIGWQNIGTGSSTSGAATVESLAVIDLGAGPALYAGGRFNSMQGVTALKIAMWNGGSWSALGTIPGTLQTVSALVGFDNGYGPALYALTQAFSIPPMTVLFTWDGASWATPIWVSTQPSHALTVFDDGLGPTIYAGGATCGFSGPPCWGSMNRLDGSSMTAVAALGWQSGHPDSLIVHDDGTGPALLAGGLFSFVAPLSGPTILANNIAKMSCGSSITVTATQASPGAPTFVNNANLRPYGEYYNLFSLDICSGGPGGCSAYGLLVNTPQSFQFLLDQFLMPLETPLFHFTAASSYLNWGPYPLPALTVDALCFDFTGGVLGSVSPVTRITIQ